MWCAIIGNSKKWFIVFNGVCAALVFFYTNSHDSILKYMRYIYRYRYTTFGIPAGSLHIRTKSSEIKRWWLVILMSRKKKLHTPSYTPLYMGCCGLMCRIIGDFYGRTFIGGECADLSHSGIDTELRFQGIINIYKNINYSDVLIMSVCVA